jgi:hypothetical protein
VPVHVQESAEDSGVTEIRSQLYVTSVSQTIQLPITIAGQVERREVYLLCIFFITTITRWNVSGIYASTNMEVFVSIF